MSVVKECAPLLYHLVRQVVLGSDRSDSLHVLHADDLLLLTSLVNVLLETSDDDELQADHRFHELAEAPLLAKEVHLGSVRNIVVRRRDQLVHAEPGVLLVDEPVAGRGSVIGLERHLAHLATLVIKSFLHLADGDDEIALGVDELRCTILSIDFEHNTYLLI